MDQQAFSARLEQLLQDHENFLSEPNEAISEYNGIFHRYQNPVLTWKHTPLFWRYDLNYETNPFLMERLEINKLH